MQRRLTNDKGRFWSITTEENGYRVKYGTINGKVIETFHHVVAKSNRTLVDQIELEVNQKIKKKLRSGYHDEEGRTLTQLEPQLATSLKTLESLTEFPYWVQPKLDGVRGLIYIKDDEVVVQSREGKFYPHLRRLKRGLRETLSRVGLPIDGELMLPNHSFNDLVSAVRSGLEEHPLNELVEFNLFDVVSSEVLTERSSLMREFYGLPGVNVIEHIVVNDADELRRRYDEFVEEGFEGIVLRRPHLPYTHGRRGKALLKYKEFIDEEGTIVEVVEGNGNEKGCAVFVLEDDLGTRFKCRPSGTFVDRKRWYDDRSSLIGKRYTYSYQEKTEYGVPRFPVALRFRDYE